MILGLKGLKVTVLFICLLYKLVSFRGLPKLRPHPDWFLLGVKFKTSDEHPVHAIWKSPPEPPSTVVTNLNYVTYKSQSVLLETLSNTTTKCSVRLSPGL